MARVACRVNKKAVGLFPPLFDSPFVFSSNGDGFVVRLKCFMKTTILRLSTSNAITFCRTLAALRPFVVIVYHLSAQKRLHAKLDAFNLGKYDFDGRHNHCTQNSDQAKIA